MTEERRPLSLRVTLIVLGIILVLLQGRLWVSEDGFIGVSRTRDQVAMQREENRQLAERNQRLYAEVRDLKSGFAALEERARADLGLVAPNETFYLISEAPADGESR